MPSIYARTSLSSAKVAFTSLAELEGYCYMFHHLYHCKITDAQSGRNNNVRNHAAVCDAKGRRFTSVYLTARHHVT